MDGEEMDVDVPDTLSSSIIAPPLFSAQLSPAVLEIDNSHTLENENGDADIVAASKGRKQADRVQPDDLVHKSPTDEPAAGNNCLEDDDFVEEEEPKLTSKKKALSKPTSAATSKSKSKAKEKRFSRKVDMRTTITTTTLLVRGPITNLCSIKQRMLDSCTIAGAGACISVRGPSLSPFGTTSDTSRHGLILILLCPDMSTVDFFKFLRLHRGTGSQPKNHGLHSTVY
ncbi:uncharacterized protein HD556DRAFT_1530665 [Suillus plorans]|uniref:Uncharacterized protein n=1 Tax=Suillus plorans TaxID=116603 RepID=A0A9P7ADF6_9AGAM|nr:uncharacterized protein HD556DRAFT_1530665 [Suillus plorans]KAG1787060.1 hypothetical protein HD556DRAFT_1530665 [Suillus plorans]